MCPSFQATRDERDSTRGRANALRLAATGQAGLNGLTDHALREVLDLCLECKACKAECPTNVDMARLKAEFLHQYHRAHGLPLRNRVFGRVADVGRWGCRLAPVSNWMVRGPLGRWLAGRFLGIDPRRVPPAFAGRTLRSRLGSLPAPDVNDPRGVLLFPDTFADYFEPAVGEAAVALLRRAGLAVWLGPPDLMCCGRPLISNGLLDRAVECARHNVERLYPWAAAGRPVVACEPSCLLTIMDDYPALLRGESRAWAESVAAACRTFEESLDSALSAEGAGPPLTFRAGPGRILVQGHCHQRALVGMGPALRLLGRMPGAEVVDLDAGCCGMAGSFGYEAEHYEVSRLVGEQRLFPALRGSDPADVVVAPGFSCRLQVRHFTGRAAVHPAELLRSLLGE
jgi:Fe-S oxidoreductase